MLFLCTLKCLYARACPQRATVCYCRQTDERPWILLWNTMYVHSMVFAIRRLLVMWVMGHPPHGRTRKIWRVWQTVGKLHHIGCVILIMQSLNATGFSLLCCSAPGYEWIMPIYNNQCCPHCGSTCVHIIFALSLIWLAFIVCSTQCMYLFIHLSSFAQVIPLVLKHVGV